jgi:hypothetical protein
MGEQPDMKKPSLLSSQTQTTGKSLLAFYTSMDTNLYFFHSTGVAGVCGIMNALIERAEKGGSFYMDVRTSPSASIFDYRTN